MKERPIIFSAPMIRAILEGTKTQTRRVVKPSGEYRLDLVCPPDGGPARCPFGQPGDRLWVRETFQQFTDDGEILYRAEQRDEEAMNELKRDEYYEARWRPAIYMPRRLSRITLEVTGLRVERLQDISTDDCWAEGIQSSPDVDPVHEYRDLWESINGPGSWESNPWVWVVEFKRAAA